MSPSNIFQKVILLEKYIQNFGLFIATLSVKGFKQWCVAAFLKLSAQGFGEDRKRYRRKYKNKRFHALQVAKI